MNYNAEIKKKKNALRKYKKSFKTTDGEQEKSGQRKKICKAVSIREKKGRELKTRDSKRKAEQENLKREGPKERQEIIN